jgi:hypothetical protein
MRLYKNAGPYHGRQPEPKPERGSVALRKGTNPTKAVVGDMKDAWLRGRDGILHPSFDKQRTGRR